MQLPTLTITERETIFEKLEELKKLRSLASYSVLNGYYIDFIEITKKMEDVSSEIREIVIKLLVERAKVYGVK